MKNKAIFILSNTIFIAILWHIISDGLIYSNYLFVRNLSFLSMLIIFFLEFGGEFLISTIFAYKTRTRLTINFFIFILIVNLILLKILVPKIYYIFIFLIIINQTFGFIFSNFLLNKKIGK